MLIDQPQHGADVRAGDAPRRRLWRWVRLLVTLGLVALVLSRLNPWQLAATLASARIDALAALVLLLLLQRCLAAFRWWLLLRCNNPGLGLVGVLRVTFGSDFAGQFLPGVVGVELLRLYGIGRLTGNTAAALSSVVTDRLLSIAALAALVLLSLPLAPSTLTLDPAIVWSGWACLAAVPALGVMAMSPRARRAVERLLPRPIARRLETRLQRLYAALDQYRARPALLAAAALLALLFQLMRVLIYAVGALALGIDAPFAAFAVFIPIIMFLTLLPISISGFGVREAAFLYLFAAVAVPPEQAVALSLFVQVVHILCTLPGAWFCAVDPPAQRNVSPAAAPRPDQPLPPTDRLAHARPEGV